ncbi:hypothetical protein CDEF62S_00334 [Castellaniella defragrans]
MGLALALWVVAASPVQAARQNDISDFLLQVQKAARTLDYAGSVYQQPAIGSWFTAIPASMQRPLQMAPGSAQR